MENGTKTFVVCDFEGHLEIFADEQEVREYNDLDNDYDISDFTTVVSVAIVNSLEKDLDVYTSAGAIEKLRELR